MHGSRVMLLVMLTKLLAETLLTWPRVLAIMLLLDRILMRGLGWLRVLAMTERRKLLWDRQMAGWSLRTGAGF